MVDTEDLPDELQSRLLDALDRDAQSAIRELIDAHPTRQDAIERFVDRFRQLAAAAAPPERIGPYEILGLLGEGGMGVVYLARDGKVGRDVALKCMKSSWTADIGMRLRFEREIAAVARLDHPAICKLFDYGHVDGAPYFAMQLVRGMRLDKVIAQVSASTTGAAPQPFHGADGAPRLPAILTCAMTLADGLAAAHARGFVHRDIKPGNIMIDERNAPVILDFGLVRSDSVSLPRVTLSGVAAGTPPYMAPEQFDGRYGEVGPHTDVYALGLVLFEMLTRRPAFRAVSVDQLRRKILAGDRPRLRELEPSVPSDVAAVVDCASAIEPRQRYASAAAFAEDLRRLLAHERIQAAQPHFGQRTWRWTQRNPVAATIVGALALTSVLAWSLVWTAQEAAASTRRHLDRFFSLATAERLRVASAEADAIHPATPTNAAHLADWLVRHAQPLAAEFTRARAVVAQMDTLRLDAQAGTVGDQRSEDVAVRFLARTLHEVLPQLERFLEHESGLVADVRRRAAWATTVYAASITAHGQAWEAAIAAIRGSDGATAHRAYAGLALAPQVGLIPIGRDPQSLLWEFYDLASAAPGAPLPGRDAAGRLELRAEHGLVFVLVPGGPFLMGAARDGEKIIDPDAEIDEVPITEITLAPFLLSKFELTQAQWARLTRGWSDHTEPSHYGPTMNDSLPPGPPKFTVRNPVEFVRWDECAEVARRHGLDLPTEAQWEFACRAGGATRYAWGNDATECAKFGNVADRAADRWSVGWGTYHDWDDGHVAHAPVGSFAPNAFGFHDMHGNVLEFCADWKLPYSVAPAAGSGMREPAAGTVGQRRVARGGCYQLPIVNARSADRHEYFPDQPSNLTGWRPARPLQSTDQAR